MTLRVKLEIVPFGYEDKTYEIGRLDIFNKGRVGSHINDKLTLCEYGCIQTGDEDQAGLFDETVFHHREDGAWSLVHHVLEELILNKGKQMTDITTEDFEKAKTALEAANVPGPYMTVQSPTEDTPIQHCAPVNNLDKVQEYVKFTTDGKVQDTPASV